MSIEELIKRYDLRRNPGGILGIYKADLAQREGAVDEIRQKKPEILAYLDEQSRAIREAAEERQRKIDAIPGLKEIKAARSDLVNWQYEFSKSFDGEGGGGVGVRPKPKYDLAEMEKGYPAAAAYLKAEKMANSYNYRLSAIGKKAMDRIISDPNSYAAAIADMEAEEK